MTDYQGDKGTLTCIEESHREPPLCPHGPTLLFVQSNNEGQVTDKYYACAACRSRKDCNFYQLYGSKEVAGKREIRKQIYEQFNLNNSLYKTHNSESVTFCVECGVVVPHILCTDSSHPYQYIELSAEHLKYPSRFIKPKESNKTNAQYFFSPEVVQFVGGLVSAQNVDVVVCVGVPSVHEHLKHADHLSVTSFLLDIDVRLRQFHSDFAHYNMFNHHFYEVEEKDRFNEFVAGAEHVMLIIDPPYGGFLQALAITLDKLKSCTNAPVTTLLFFPYFMEPQVSKHLPQLVMSDYKVSYSNHAGYKGSGQGQVRGSPARIYTDVPMKELVLPTDSGYWYCSQCEKYVSKENAHCPTCDRCTTKDGPTYQHCNTCMRCVKPSWAHCDKCNRCELPQHRCKKREAPSGSLELGKSINITSHKRKRNKTGNSLKNRNK